MAVGKGIRNVDQFLAHYRHSALVGPNVHPDLEFSLEQLRAAPELPGQLEGLGGSPACLIAGYSSPRNGGAILRFLNDCGVHAPKVEAFDLYDVQAMHPSIGWPVPSIIVHVADACNLSGHFDTASQDLAVQDFLLNCAPPVDHTTILGETARVLRPGGLLIVSFTDWSGLADLPAREVADLERSFALSWSDRAYCLQDLAGERAPDLLGELSHTVVRHPSGEWLIWIGAESGHIEYYSSMERTQRLIEEAGFELMVHRRSRGSDGHGLDCSRHHCVYVRLPEAVPGGL